MEKKYFEISNINGEKIGAFENVTNYTEYSLHGYIEFDCEDGHVVCENVAEYWQVAIDGVTVKMLTFRSYQYEGRRTFKRHLEKMGV